MKSIRCKQIAVFTVTVIAIALLAPRAPAAPNSPPGPSVTVVNTQTNPVPVSVLNFPTGANTVQVSSSSNAPVFVRDVDKIARTPFAELRILTVTNGVRSTEQALLTPPLGKRAVIETVTASILVPPGQTPLAGLVVGTDHFIALTRQGSLSGNDLYVGTFAVRFYDLGKPSFVDFIRDPATGNATAEYSISGYLEDAP